MQLQKKQAKRRHPRSNLIKRQKSLKLYKITRSLGFFLWVTKKKSTFPSGETNNKSYSRIIGGINGRIHCHDIGGVPKKIALTESAAFSFL
jgi:hypothetical protein